MNDNNKLLEDGLSKINIKYSDVELKKINTYISELILFNSKFDLINTQDKDEIIIRHIFDSLSLYPIIDSIKPNTIADIGTGAGLPGIPLAIFFQDIQFTLIDRSKKRITFLENILAMLNIKNVKLECIDLNTISTKYDFIVSRALTDVSLTIIKKIFFTLKENGNIFLYKGNIQKTKKDFAALIKNIEMKNFFYGVVPISVPFLDAERCFLHISNKADVSFKFCLIGRVLDAMLCNQS